MRTDTSTLLKDTVEQASILHKTAMEALTSADKQEYSKYAKMMDSPDDKIHLMRLMDESTQIDNPQLLIKRIKNLHNQYGTLGFLTKSEKLMFQFFLSFGELAPKISIPAFKSYLRKSTARVIINEKPSKFYKHIDFRKKDHIGQNVNLIGEVVQGEDEALARYHHYLDVLTNPRVTYISIKISGIYSQLHPLNYEQSKAILMERLSNIYRQAMKHTYTDENGIKRAKFINLDMEEYKDLELTYDIFTSVLGRDEFKSLYAGLVLQAYLPDTVEYQKRLIAWAQNRVKQGGSPIKMRLVKGANLQMETVVSSLKGWEVPVFDSKIQSDANYLRMLDYAMKKEHIEAVHLGIASHNIFSISYAQKKAAENGVEKYVSYEMLEGMANNLVKAMHNLNYNIILYTPVVTDENFLNAVSYLVRRLDENTSVDNFLSHSFNLKVGDQSWDFLLDQFKQAISIKDILYSSPKRTQNRTKDHYDAIPTDAEFTNEPDTDFDLHQNLEWSKEIIKKWKFGPESETLIIPSQVGNTTHQTTNSKTYIDNSQAEEYTVYKMYQTSQEQLEEVVQIAENDPSGWRKMSGEERHQILAQAAKELRNNRNNLIGCMMAVTGKTIMEGDVEVSEAIDFLEFYPRTAKHFFTLPNVTATGKGIVLVIPPWNFPLAIPLGGVAAALSAGNTVIIKPASASAPVAYEFVKLMHKAGVPKEALQLVLPEKRESLNYLTGHSSIKHIIFTGGTSTAYHILENNPQVPLSAETGGKNAIILTDNGDRDIALYNAVRSAFGNAGQKCSACSLLLLQKEIFNDKTFKARLKNAVESLNVGSPWEMSSEIGPMIAPQSQNKELMHAISNLEAGESWLVEPKLLDDKGYIMTPGVKWNVKPDSYTFKTELFSPLLAVVCFDTLDEAIDMVNSTGYGLTSGLITLSTEEQKIWSDKIEAGNLYINRGITGAIVQRQPFGGMKESAFGSGVKAGSPNYVSCFMDFEEEQVKSSESNISSLGLSDQLSKAIKSSDKCAQIAASAESYRKIHDDYFSKMLDPSKIIGEDNHLRYLPAKDLQFRINKEDKWEDVLTILAAIEVANPLTMISIDTEYDKIGELKLICPTAKIEAYYKWIVNPLDYKRLRLCSSSVSDEIYEKLASKGICVLYGKPLQEGRVELIKYLQEQSLTNVYHRYGNLGEREVK